MSAAAAGYDSSAIGRLSVFLALAAAAFVVATRAPLDVAIFGVLVLGLPHVALEVRYVYGRFGQHLDRWLIVTMQVVLVVVVVNRAFGSGRGARVNETLLLGGLLVFAALGGRHRVRRRPWLVASAVAATLVATALAIAGLDSWFLVQTHLHNILPLAFLWEWTATELAPAARRRWRVAVAAVFVGGPALFLTGLVDPLLARSRGLLPSTADADVTTRVSTTIAPVGVDAVWAARLLAAFAFAQLVHYAVWCWFLPRSRAGKAATARLEATRLSPAIRGWRYAAAIGVGVTVIGALAWSDLRGGRTTYTSLAAYHALLEYPLLILMVRGAVGHRPGPAGVPEITQQFAGCPGYHLS